MNQRITLTGKTCCVPDALGITPPRAQQIMEMISLALATGAKAKLHHLDVVCMLSAAMRTPEELVMLTHIVTDMMGSANREQRQMSVVHKN